MFCYVRDVLLSVHLTYTLPLTYFFLVFLNLPVLAAAPDILPVTLSHFPPLFPMFTLYKIYGVLSFPINILFQPVLFIKSYCLLSNSVIYLFPSMQLSVLCVYIYDVQIFLLAHP